MACLTRTEDVRTARGDNHCSEQVLLKILMLACVGYFIASYQSEGSGIPGLTITSNPGSGNTDASRYYGFHRLRPIPQDASHLSG